MDNDIDTMHATLIQLHERLKANESYFNKIIDINEQIDQWPKKIYLFYNFNTSLLTFSMIPDDVLLMKF